MNKKLHTPELDTERGMVASYVIGFILSLVFTFIPYHLVVNKTLTGNSLLAIILGFAILQMFVQIFFFLHLGRGPKPLYNIVFFFATVAAIFVVVAGSIFIMNNLYTNMTPSEISKMLAEKEGIYQIGGEKTGACQALRTNHKVFIRNGTIGPIHTEARLCDTLTFINEDDQSLEIAFGSHENHQSYSGEMEVTARKGRAKMVVLNQVGEYMFHGHIEPETAGTFNVTDDTQTIQTETEAQ